MHLGRDLFVAALAAAAAPSASAAANLIVNGDFEAGATGFASQYAQQNPAWDPATFAVAASPHDVHPLWASFGDHTTGEGKMMIVNGAEQTGVGVWSQGGIGVQAGATYYFSTWIRSVYDDAPARLSFMINGQQIGSTFTAGAVAQGWRQFYAVWNSGSATEANIALFNESTAYTGNDFALDDIAFSIDRPAAAIPEPATWAMLLLGFGGAGALLRRRRTLALFA